MKIFVAHSSDFDFKTKLYEPLRASALTTEHEIRLPQEGERSEITKEMIRSIDVLVADISRPSLGAGIEMGWASAFDIPVIGLHEKGSKVSFSVENVLSDRIEYENAQELIEKLTSALAK